MVASLCDELPFGFGWIAPQPRYLSRASHALADDGRVWLIDAVDVEGLDGRVAALGEVAGVVQLVDRHARDCAALASRYGVPLYETPFGGVPGSPFEVLRVVNVPTWREAALWWSDRRTLVAGDALGTVRYFRAPGEQLAVHPLLRLLPPRSLARFDPDHVLCGHGEGVHGPDAARALHDALRSSRTRIARWLFGLARRQR